MAERYKKAGPKKSGDKIGPPVQAGLPELLQTIFRSIYTREEVKDCLAEVEMPENCPALKPVCINKEIYGHMTEKERKADEPLKFIANALAKASQLLVYAWDQLLKAEQVVRKSDNYDADQNVVLDLSRDISLDLTATITKIDQCLGMLGMANSQVVQKRRMDLTYKLAWDCKELSRRNRPFTDFLFGDNMKESAVETRKERAISYGVSSKEGKTIPSHLYQEFMAFLAKKNNWNRDKSQQFFTNPNHYQTNQYGQYNQGQNEYHQRQQQQYQSN